VTDLLVGIDVGGTKTHVQARTLDGTLVVDEVFATTGWRGAAMAVKADLLMTWIAQATTDAPPLAIGVGAHGCDSAAQCRELHDALADRAGVPCAVVNDAQLLAAAAGVEEGIGLIAGTGSIAAGRLPDGEPVYAGGWGWLLGDDGGAAGLVREAVRRALAAQDQGRGDEILTACLVRAAGVGSLGDLSMSMMLAHGGSWARHCPAVFEAADRGSPLAAEVIDDGGAALAELVATVRRRGALGRQVVAGGGVIVHQPRLAAALATALDARQPGVSLQVLADPPVLGAVALAARASSRPPAWHTSD
jgi:N-acetylglucosamine kinase-like BadF-type ATPase